MEEPFLYHSSFFISILSKAYCRALEIRSVLECEVSVDR